MSSQISDGKFSIRRDGQDSKMTPIYMEELALSRFIEDYLDFMIPDIYKQYNGYAETGDKSVSAATKVMNDIVMILETDRVIIKTYNALVAM